MPGRLRQGTGLSDKAQNCCNKCCQACCRMSPWNKVMCYSMSFLIVGSILVLIVGAFAASGTDNSGTNICTVGLGLGIGGSSSNSTAPPPSDPNIPLVNKNAFTWWLANAGVFCILMIIMSCLCCFSYITLCCGYKFPTVLKVLAIIALVLLLIGFSLYVMWLGFGTYLMTLYGPGALLQKVCIGIVFYIIFMYIYLISFVVAAVAAILFCMCGGGKEDENKKSRENKKSNLKMPPTKLLTAMV